MSAVTQQPRRSGPGRVLAIIASVFLMLIGLSLAVGGSVLMAVFGSDGEIRSADHPVASPTAAVVTDIAGIRDTSDVADVLGTPIARLSAQGGNASGLFIGIGPATEVDRYLAGVEVDQAVNVDVDPFVLDLSRRDGSVTNAPPPSDQVFWVASASGPNVDMSWRVQDGDYRVVVMNADGTAGLDSRLSLGLGLSGIFGVGLGMLIGGVVLIIIAIALLVATRPRSQPAPAIPDGRYPGPVYPGPDYAGTGQPGPGQVQPGWAQPGQDQQGWAQPGQVQPNPVQPSQAQPVRVQPGQGQTGQGQPGQGQTGQGQPGQGQPGQGQPGQVPTGNGPPDVPGPDAGQTGPDGPSRRPAEPLS